MQILPPVFPIYGKSPSIYSLRWANVGVSTDSRGEAEFDEREVFSTIPFGPDDEPAPLEPGDTGQYTVGITGGFGMDQYLSGSMGSFFVETHTPWTMRVRLSGKICRSPVMPNTCPGARTIEGQASKALPIFYQPLGGLVIEDTPGTQQYREMLRNLRSTAATAPTSPPTPPVTVPMPTLPGVSQGQGDCDCSCDTYKKIQKMTDSPYELSADEMAEAVQLMMGVAMCGIQCQQQFDQCE